MSLQLVLALGGIVALLGLGLWAFLRATPPENKPSADNNWRRGPIRGEEPSLRNDTLPPVQVAGGASGQD